MIESPLHFFDVPLFVKRKKHSFSNTSGNKGFLEKLIFLYSLYFDNVIRSDIVNNAFATTGKYYQTRKTDLFCPKHVSLGTSL